MITTNTKITILDPEDQSTWVNTPEPVDVSVLQREMAGVGGVVPSGFGENSGQPMCKIIWCQEHLTWLNGAMRIAYDDDRIQPIRKLQQFSVTQRVYENALRWYEKREGQRQQAFLDANWKGFQKFPNFADFLENECSPLDYNKLSPDADPITIAALMPSGWRYLPGLFEVTEIGKQNFTVVQWLAPDHICAEENWNKSRFDWAHYPETNDEQFIDCLGEYPRHGDWVHTVFDITTKRKNKDGEIEPIYTDPNMSNSVERLAELIRVQREMHHQTKEARSEMRRKLDESKAEAKSQKFKQSFDEKFDDAVPTNRAFSFPPSLLQQKEQ